MNVSAALILEVREVLLRDLEALPDEVAGKESLGFLQRWGPTTAP